MSAAPTCFKGGRIARKNYQSGEINALCKGLATPTGIDKKKKLRENVCTWGYDHSFYQTGKKTETKSGSRFLVVENPQKQGIDLASNLARDRR